MEEEGVEGGVSRQHDDEEARKKKKGKERGRTEKGKNLGH